MQRYRSSEFHVLRCGGRVMPRYLFGYLNRAVIRQEAEKVMAGKSGHRRVPVRFYQQLQIPLPSLDGQKKIIRIVERHESEIGRFKDRLRELEKKKDGLLKEYL
ncbi:MAG: hypothetical protein HFH42_10000 [Lachnospiraceae bacterium]|nr:hypothetical protein [Lachnospiraceae bacterium]